MKLINKFAILALGAAAMASCSHQYDTSNYYPSADVDFTYEVDGEEYVLDFYVVSTIKFNNISSKTGAYRWDFGDGTTSTEASPSHKYETAGMYKVTLSIEGIGTRTYPLMINDITPSLTVATQSTEIVEFNNTELTFALELPNPENLPVKYKWIFPEGTTYIDGTPATEFEGMTHEDGTTDYPQAVKFRNIGSQRIEIQTTFDTRENGKERRLADAFLNVQVGVSEPAPTLYYAERGGNIKAMKILDNIPEGSKVMPYDMGVSSGSTVYNLACNSMPVKTDNGEEGEGEENAASAPARAAAGMEDWIYILDAGKQYYYINDENGVLGDGNITAMRADGTGVNVVITNVGGAAFNDPYRAFIEGASNLCYSDRNTGFTRIDCATRGAVEGKDSDNRRGNYVMTNENTPFKDQGISWGAATNGIYKDKNGWWWVGKFFNGYGIFRFKDSDIYANETEAKKHGKPSEVLLSGTTTSTFAVDEANGRWYAWQSRPTQAFLELPIVDYTATVKTSDATKTINMDCTPDNTTAEEGLFVTQMAIDNNTGKVYFCFRPEATDASGIHAGIAVYDPATGVITNYGDSYDLGTGIVINPSLTKLF
ncbi:MAG: PKD domain-containing protein [Muribaculaceae bacterium]|nr:PKD domain-containing protein [Muribaculaceae bacterium]